MLLATIFTICLGSYMCHNINEVFQNINENYVKLNSKAAEIAWEIATEPNSPDLVEKSAKYQRDILLWQHSACESLATLFRQQLLDSAHRRQTYLLCRGPIFTYKEARKLSLLYEKLASAYSSTKVCVPMRNTTENTLANDESAILDYLTAVKEFTGLTDVVPFAAKMAANSDVAENVMCLERDNDFDRIMKNSRNEDVLKWVWLGWREKMGEIREPYNELVQVENKAALRNGYSDIGASWREELEIPNLRQFCRHLYSEIKPLYTLLHGVVRFFLRRTYGEIVSERGPIPAHLLGDLWAQNWESLVNLILPNSLDLDASIKKHNWSVFHMVKRVDDFYQSMGLPAMTDTFWRESVFEDKNGETLCHGTAADMFKDGDYRLLYCSGTTMEDFSVLHHEFGHIHYYMAYSDQPGIFRQANAALHESIGDAIMYGVMTPQHLHRLGLVNDSVLYTNQTRTVDDTDDTEVPERNAAREFNGILEYANKNIRLFPNDETDSKQNYSEENYILDDDNSERDNDITPDEIILLKQALNKIPQIPFALLLDEYRWKYFEGSIKGGMNEYFWELALELQGIEPPEVRGEEYFDIGAKFHVPDNTAYIRYFLSSFIQHQIFEALCRAAVFGRRDISTDIPDSISLNRCDIYGSKAAGRLLKDLMSRGHSQHLREILQSTTGNTDITASALLRYYRHLQKVLMKIVERHHIPLGW